MIAPYVDFSTLPHSTHSQRWKRELVVINLLANEGQNFEDETQMDNLLRGDVRRAYIGDQRQRKKLTSRRMRDPFEHRTPSNIGPQGCATPAQHGCYLISRSQFKLSRLKVYVESTSLLPNLISFVYNVIFTACRQTQSKDQPTPLRKLGGNDKRLISSLSPSLSQLTQVEQDKGSISELGYKLDHL